MLRFPYACDPCKAGVTVYRARQRLQQQSNTAAVGRGTCCLRVDEYRVCSHTHRATSDHLAPLVRIGSNLGKLLYALPQLLKASSRESACIRVFRQAWSALYWRRHRKTHGQADVHACGRRLTSQQVCITSFCNTLSCCLVTAGVRATYVTAVQSR